MSILRRVVTVPLAFLLVALLGVTLSVVQATPASAHQGNIKVSDTQCVDGNSMKATYTVGWTNGTSSGVLYTKLGLYGGSSDNNGWSKEKDVSGSSGSTSFTKTHSFSGSNGPWVAFKIVFSDGYVVGGDTRVEGWNWDKCKPAKPDDVPSVDFEERCDLKAYGFPGVAGIVKRTGIATHTWNGEKWVLGDTKWGNWKVDHEYTDDEYFKNCAGDNPGPKYGEWSDWSSEQPTCEKTTVTQTRTRTKTTYKWDVSKRDWVVDEVTTEHKERTIKLSDEDFWALGCAGDKPDPKPLSDSKDRCELTELGFPGLSGFISRTGSQPYVKGDREWVLGEKQWKDWVYDRDYTDQEFFDNCAGKPEPDKVETEKGKWVGEPTCEAPSIYQTREVTTTTTKQQWNTATRQWEWAAPVSVTITEIAKEPTTLSEAEVKACHPKDAPKVTYEAQTCIVGDQGVGEFHGGSLSITADGWTVKVFDKDAKEVTDLTNLNPGDYTVLAALSNPDTTSPGNIDGWKANEDGSISKVVTVPKADDCTVLPADPIRVPQTDGYSTCDGVFSRSWDEVSYPEWVDGKWILADPVVENDTGFVKVRDLTNDEWVELGCVPDEPEPLVKPKSDSKMTCEGVFERSWDVATYYDWVWFDQPREDGSRGEWVLGSSTVENDTDWQKVRSLTGAEKDAKGCVATTPPPSLPNTGAGDSMLAYTVIALIVTGVGVVMRLKTLRRV